MPNFIGLRHVGWGVKDPAALAAFYRDVLGMTVVTEFPAGTPPLGATVFLARHPDQHDDHASHLKVQEAGVGLHGEGQDGADGQ